MKRFTLFWGHLIALFIAGISSMQLYAEAGTAGNTVTVTVNKTNGTATKTNGTVENGTGYFNFWTSNETSGLAGVKIASGTVNNMNYPADNIFMLVFNANALTYKISAPTGYIITGYTLTGKITQNNGTDATGSVANVTITPQGGTATTFTHTAEATMTVSGLKTQETSFTSSVNAPLRVNSMTITLEKMAHITLQCKTNTGYNFTVTDYYQIGSPITPPCSYYTFTTATPESRTAMPTGNVTAEMDGQTYEVNLTEAFPFTVNKFYQLHLVNDNNYVTANSSTGAVTIATTAPTDACGLWMFKHVPGTVDQFYVLNGSDHQKGLVYAASSNASALTLNDYTLPLKVTANNSSYKGFNLEHPTAKNACANNTSNVLKFWTAANDQNSSFKVVEVTQPATVKLVYTDELQQSFEREISLTNVQEGTTVSSMKQKLTEVANLADYTNISFTSSDETTISKSETTSLNLTCQNHFPFTVSKADSKKWNILRTRSNNNGNTLISNGANVNTGSNSAHNSSLNTLDRFDFGLWAFVKENGTPNSFKIYNHADNKAMTLTNTTSNSQDVTMTDNGTVFKALRKSDNTVVFYVDNPNVNTIGDHHNGLLSTWSNAAASNDAGSIFQVVSDDTKLAEAGVYVLNNSTVPCNCVNGLTEENLDAAKKAKTLNDFLEKIKSENRYQLKSDRLYTITFENQNVVMSADDMIKGDNSDDKRLVKTVNTDAQKQSANALWRFVTSGDKYKLVHANSSYYLGSNVNDANSTVNLTVVQDQQYAPEYILNISNRIGKAGLQNAKVGEAQMKYLHSVYQGPNSQNTNLSLILWSGSCDNAAGSRMTIQEVKFFPVTITDVNYATLCLPFAVNLPTEDGIKAWKGTTAEEGLIRLTELSGVLPANTPVILTNNAGTETKSYNFAIAYETTAAAPEDNALKGTTIKETIAANNTAYILKNGGHGVGMYKIDSETDRTIPTNRAYYATDAQEEQSQMMAFDFGTTTSIENTLTPATLTDDTFYDLNGRRVLFPTHGVYVKQNGEKIYIQ